NDLHRLLYCLPAPLKIPYAVQEAFQPAMNKTTISVFSRLVFAFGFAAVPLLAQKIEHPLDPLSFQEYWTVLEVLRDAGHLNAETRFSMINLREPPKSLVWGWSKGQDFPREAFAVVRQGTEAFEAVADLKQQKVVSWTKLDGVQPNWLREELGAMGKEVKK